MTHSSDKGLGRIVSYNHLYAGYFGGGFGALGVALGFLLYQSGDIRTALVVLIAGSAVSLLAFALMIIERNKRGGE